MAAVKAAAAVNVAAVEEKIGTKTELEDYQKKALATVVPKVASSALLKAFLSMVFLISSIWAWCLLSCNK